MGLYKAEISGLRYKLDDAEILQGVDIQGSEGEITSILWAFGCREEHAAARRKPTHRANRRRVLPGRYAHERDEPAGAATACWNDLPAPQALWGDDRRRRPIWSTLGGRDREVDAHELLEKVSLDPNLKGRNPQSLFGGQ